MAEKKHASNEEAKPAEPKPEAKIERSEQPKEMFERPERSKEGGKKIEGEQKEEVAKQLQSQIAPSSEGSTFRREREPARERKARKDDNVVFVGKKPTMSYVLAVITQFSDGNSEVFVKARGRSISRAVDVIEVVKKKFMQDLKCEMDTDTEVITDERNQRINVSTFSGKLFK
jgi:DNA-binding protein